jgi:hypothetical protein
MDSVVNELYFIDRIQEFLGVLRGRTNELLCLAALPSGLKTYDCGALTAIERLCRLCAVHLVLGASQLNAVPIKQSQ